MTITIVQPRLEKITRVPSDTLRIARSAQALEEDM